MAYGVLAVMPAGRVVGAYRVQQRLGAAGTERRAQPTNGEEGLARTPGRLCEVSNLALQKIDRALASIRKRSRVLSSRLDSEHSVYCRSRSEPGERAVGLLLSLHPGESLGCGVVLSLKVRGRCQPHLGCDERQAEQRAHCGCARLFYC